MSFDLVVVGGTGQWLLLELCLRLRRDQKELFPDNVWVVDRDLGPISHLAGGSNTSQKDHLAQVLGEELEKVDQFRGPGNHHLLSRIACLPAVGEATHLQALLSEPKHGDVAWAATTQIERNTDVRHGFFALPRLSAIWTSIKGFQGHPQSVVNHDPTFLQDTFLAPEGTNPRPLVVVGSLSGGTGAGLLPYLYQRLRNAPVSEWRRPVVIVAVLPWFVPPVQTDGQFQTITWERCCRNACSGIKALYRVSRDLRSRAMETGGNQVPAALPSTTCVLAGPPIPEARATVVAGLQPFVAAQRGFISPTIQILADALPDLIDAGAAQFQRERFSFGTIQALFLREQAGGTRQLANEVVPLHAVGTYWAALRAQAVARMDFEHAAHLSYGPLANLQQVSGLRQTLGPTVLSATLSRRELTQAFLAGFAGRLLQRAEELQAAFDLQISPSAAGHLPTIFAELDKTLSDAERRSLWKMADVKDGKTAIRATSAADFVFEALLRASDRSQGNGKFRAEGLNVEVRRFLPLHPEQADKRAERTSYQGLPGALDGGGEVEALAELYAQEGAIGTEECDSRSYATFLGTAHIAADLTRNLAPGQRPDDQNPLRRAVTLWRGFLHGLLDIVDVSPERRNQIVLTEGSLDSERSFGDGFRLVTISVPSGETRTSVALGLVSADLGFVPHTDLLETASPPPVLQSAFDELERRLAQIEPDATRDDQVLAAFARHCLPQQSFNAPPWYRLLTSLRPAYAQSDEIERWLYSRAVRSRSLMLQITAESRPVEVYLPLRLDRAAVTRILAAERQNLFVAKTDSLGFQPFAGGPIKPLLRFIGNGGTRRVVWFDAAEVARAASAVPAVPAGFDDAALSWPQHVGLPLEGGNEQVL